MARKDPEKDLEYKQQYRAVNRDKINEKARQKYEATGRDEAAIKHRRTRRKQYYADNREKLAEDMRSRRAANREQYNEYMREYHAKHPEKNREYFLKNKYNITPEEYHRMLIEQCGCCAMCDEQSKELVVDHSHDDGRVRDLLCNTCNLGFGHYERPGFPERAARYKAKHAKE